MLERLRRRWEAAPDDLELAAEVLRVAQRASAPDLAASAAARLVAGEIAAAGAQWESETALTRSVVQGIEDHGVQIVGIAHLRGHLLTFDAVHAVHGEVEWAVPVHVVGERDAQPPWYPTTITIAANGTFDGDVFSPGTELGGFLTAACAGRHQLADGWPLWPVLDVFVTEAGPTLLSPRPPPRLPDDLDAVGRHALLAAAEALGHHSNIAPDRVVWDGERVWFLDAPPAAIPWLASGNFQWIAGEDEDVWCSGSPGYALFGSPRGESSRARLLVAVAAMLVERAGASLGLDRHFVWQPLGALHAPTSLTTSSLDPELRRVLDAVLATADVWPRPEATTFQILADDLASILRKRAQDGAFVRPGDEIAAPASAAAEVGRSHTDRRGWLARMRTWWRGRGS